jgi:hypothetical protein
LTVVGEAWVRILPDARTFAPMLEEEVVAGSAKAGAAGGKAAGTSFGKSFGSALKTGLALVGIAEGARLVKDSITAATAHAGAVAVLDKATQNARASNELYGTSLESLIRKEAILKGFNDESLYQSFTRLVGVTHDSAKAFKDVGLAEDVARGRHIDVAIAALALTKAEQGSVTSLQRLGIVIPKHITQLQGAAKATAALALVQARFGGESVAFANSSAGATARLGEDVHILTEAFGEALLPEIGAVSKSLSGYLSNQDNLDRIQKDVAQGGHEVAVVARGIGEAFKIADKTIVPAVDALGGFGKVAELVIGAVFLRKIVQATSALKGLFVTTVAGETASAAATTEYTATLAANTAALEANAAAQKLRLGGLGTATGGFGRGGGVAAIGEDAAVAAPEIEAASVSAAGLAGVLSGPMVIGAAAAGYGLSLLIRKIPGWNGFFDSLGSHAEHAAEKLGLVGGGAPKAGSPGAGDFTGQNFAANQSKLADAYQRALALPGFARDAFVQNAVGKAYDFHDAQIAAEHLGKALVTRADTLIDETLRRAAEIAAQDASSSAGPSGPSADSAQALALAKALGTKSTADEEAIYKQRADFISGEINRLQAQGTLTTKQAKTLAGYYTERKQYEDDIASIEDAAAQARQSAAQKAAARHAKEVAARKAELAAANTAYRSGLSLQEQRLQIQVERAQLTEKSVADDRKADLALLAFYRKESHDMKLTEAERLQYQSQAISTQLTLKNLKNPAGTATGATLNQIFGEAASEFSSFGSNIGGRNAPLSGQDERARLSQILLEHRHKQSEQAAAIRHVAAQSEAAKQTGYLARIAQALAPVGTKARPPAPKAKTARSMSRIPR